MTSVEELELRMERMHSEQEGLTEETTKLKDALVMTSGEREELKIELQVCIIKTIMHQSLYRPIKR